MKKVLFIIAFIFCFSLLPVVNSSFCYASTEQIIVNVSYTYLYKTTDLEEHYDFKIYNQEKIELVNTQASYYQVNYVYEENSYSGYIKKEFASPYQPEQTTILVYNGKTIKPTEVYDITTGNPLNINLNKQHEIYIYEKYNSKNEFTNIKFEYNNQVYTGKVLTENISPNGVNKTFIIAISIIGAIAGIVLILLGLKSKNKWLKWFKKNKK